MTAQTQAPAPAAKTKTRRKDAYLATVRVAIPLDMANADSLADAIKAVQGMKVSLPTGASFEVDGRLGKV